MAPAHLSSFLLAAGLVIVVPGPATVFVAARAQRGTHSAGWATAGIVAGDLVLIGLSGLGLSALFSRWPALLLVVKISGALYVAWLGLQLLRPIGTQRTEIPGDGGFVMGLLLTLTNPKPILFFSAFFPMFIDPATHSWLGSFYLLGVWFEALNLAYFGTLSWVVIALQRSGALGGLSERWLRRISGCGLLLCAALIVTSAL